MRNNAEQGVAALFINIAPATAFTVTLQAVMQRKEYVITADDLASQEVSLNGTPLRVTGQCISEVYLTSLCRTRCRDLLVQPYHVCGNPMLWSSHFTLPF